MIEFIQFKSGYPLGLPWVGERVFKFKPGINVLFGPNGCGKSTILNTLKAYSGIPLGGWTTYNSPDKLASKQFPMAYMALAPDQCIANVMWDGTPTFYNDGVVKIDPNVFFNKMMRGEATESPDGFTSEDEQLDILESNCSTGQYRAIMTNKVLNQVRKIPDLINEKHAFSHIPFANNEIDYWKSLPRKGPQTVLLDEPERALSIPMQEKLFHVVLPLFKDLQVIVATHSVFALNTPHVNLIEFETNYIKQCQEALKW